MKKLIILIFAIASACICGYAMSNTALLLHHEGNVTIFDGPTHLNEALNAAVDGDTLFLPKGSYTGFTVSKKITIRGAGEDQTQINGYVSIELPTGTELQSTLLEGLWLMDGYSIYLKGNPKGVTISKCRIPYFNTYSYNSTAENLIIDRCLITGNFGYYNGLTSVSIINSKIKNFSVNYESKDDVIIYNSNIYYVENMYNFRGSIINSIIGCRYSSSQYDFSYMNLINTLLGYGITTASSVHAKNVYKKSEFLLDSNTLECTISNEDLLNDEYLGTDGTIVGCYGGSTPFTLALDVPVVSDTKLEVDNVNKVLNVTLKVGAIQAEKSENSGN